MYFVYMVHQSLTTKTFTMRSKQTTWQLFVIYKPAMSKSIYFIIRILFSFFFFFYLLCFELKKKKQKKNKILNYLSNFDILNLQKVRWESFFFYFLKLITKVKSTFLLKINCYLLSSFSFHIIVNAMNTVDLSNNYYAS